MCFDFDFKVIELLQFWSLIYDIGMKKSEIE